MKPEIKTIGDVFAKSFNFYHLHDKTILYTWNPNGYSVSWFDDIEEMGMSTQYDVDDVLKYVTNGTWTIVE